MTDHPTPGASARAAKGGAMPRRWYLAANESTADQHPHVGPYSDSYDNGAGYATREDALVARRAILLALADALHGAAAELERSAMRSKVRNADAYESADLAWIDNWNWVVKLPDAQEIISRHLPREDQDHD